jgi:hypothetical protein
MRHPLAALAILLAVLAGSPACGDPTPAEPAAAPSHRWRAGDVHAYSFDWQVDTELELAGLAPGDDGRVRMRLTGALDLRVHVGGPGAVLGLRFARVDAVALDVFGAPGWDEPAAAAQLVGPEVLCELGPDGAIAAAYFEPDAPPLFRHLAAGLLVHADLRLPDPTDEPREVTTPGHAGLQRATYTRDGDRVRRALVGYSDVRAVPGAVLVGGRVDAAGEAVTTLGPDGVPSAISARESLRIVDPTRDRPRYAASARFSLERVDGGRFDGGAGPPSLAGRERHVPGEPVDDPEATRDLHARFAADLTPEAMLVELQLAAPDVPVREAFIVETTGLLRARPELAAHLLPLFLDPDVDDTVRGRIFDVLSSAGTPEAQAVMREALAVAPVQADRDLHARLLARFAFVRAPEAASATHVLTTHLAAAGDPDDPLYLTTLHTLGSVGRRASGRDPAVGAALHAALLLRLDAARTNDERIAALAGLGNYASAADVPRILVHAAAPAPEVRAQAATSLRRIPAPAARAALLDLVGDPDGDVAIAALGALDGMEPTVADADAVASLLAAGAVTPEIHAHAANVFSRWLAEEREVLGAPARRGLLALADRTTDPEQRRLALALAGPS